MGAPALLRRWAPLGLLLAATALAVAVAELATRWLDGFRLGGARLLLARPSPALDLPAARRHLTRLPAPAGVELRWFEEDPPPLPSRPRDPQLEALFRQARDSLRANEVIRLWNRRLVVEELRRASDGGHFAGFPDAFFVFVPPQETPRPVYRLPRGITAPNGLSTNRLGFRGPEIPLDKPPGRVRIAFVGASTTQGPADGGFSYPERVVHWLNLWLAGAGSEVRVDGINAGREGINSPDIAAIVVQELLPLEPDLVVYYEGSNQFSFRELLLSPSGEPLEWQSRAQTKPGWLEDRSALARRLSVATGALRRAGGRELQKPEYVLDWPAGLDEQAPDLSRTELPAGLRRALLDLETIRGALASAHAELALCSFVWQVREGMVLDPVRDAQLHDYLNRSWWPYRYRDLRRMADLQNRALRQFAKQHGLRFLDVAGRFPEDPTLFGDAVHMRPAGTRLMAWVVFLEMLPWFEDRLAAGALPRPDRDQLTRHPNQAPRWRFAWRASMLARQRSGATHESDRQAPP